MFFLLNIPTKVGYLELAVDFFVFGREAKPGIQIVLVWTSERVWIRI